MSFFYALFAFLIALGPLIVFHELGHYWVARWCGVKVLRFSLGFGRPLLRSVRGADRTEWVLSSIPFGGYVSMLDEREQKNLPDIGRPYSEAELKRAFNRQSVWKRIAIVAAGPFANLLLAVAIFWVVGMYGVEEPRALLGKPPAETLAANAGIDAGDEVRAVDGEPVLSLTGLRWQLLRFALDGRSARLELADSRGRVKVSDLDFAHLQNGDLESDFMQKTGLVPIAAPPVIRETVAGDAAERAGIRAGDRVVAIDEHAVDTADELRKIIGASAGKTLRVKLDRGGAGLQLALVPEEKTEPDSGKKVGRIGVKIGAPLPMTTVRYGPVDALFRAVSRTWEVSALSLDLLGKMLTGEISLKSLSGPVTIADYAGAAAHLGIIVYLSFIAGISISVGIMNLLPIPMLDGGHLMYYLVEILSGSPPSQRLMDLGQKAGLLVLTAMMAVALFNDFSRLLP